ncbi:MAG: right-handed parallel beta-helix repeat-containing protein, partial [Saprospiraceae bacterium]
MKPAKSLFLTGVLVWFVHFSMVAQCPTIGSTVVVTNTSSDISVPNSFAWAINCINITTPLTTIRFNIPPAGINTIFLTVGLPVVTKPNAVIDGTITESVIVDGTSVGGAAPINGLVLSGSGITVRGIQIRNFTHGSTGGHAIRITGSTGYNIEDNFLYGNRIGIGTTTTNLNLSVTGNTIGLDGAGLPDGNTANGIVFSTPVMDADISDNTIAHNGAGITIPTGSTVRISENSMFCNAGAGIDRTDGPGVPIITNASTAVVSGTATAGHLVEVFEHDLSNCPITTACQGRTFLGAVTASAVGTWTLNLTAANPVNPANSVTATATQSGSNTSRFATCRSIVNCNTFTVSITVNPIDCNGGSNGSLTAVPSGTPGPYTYSWNTGATTSTISGLGPGTYTVVVMDAAGCSFTAAATLSDPPLLTLDFSTTNVSCAGAANGSATALPDGGVPGYNYLWNTGAMTPTISNLAPGTYSVTVNDVNPCRIIGSVTITEPAALTLNVTSTDETMFGAEDGTATATVAGGTGPYEYLWSNGGVTSTITGLAPGTYPVTVTDANDCTIEGSATVAPFDCGAFSVTIDGNDPLCNGESTGSATAIPVGGTAPYDYIWNTGAMTPTISG